MQVNKAKPLVTGQSAKRTARFRCKLSDHNMSIIAFSKLDIERKGVSDSCPRQSCLSISVLRDTRDRRFEARHDIRMEKGKFGLPSRLDAFV